jgi:hypothetical protein
MFKHPSDDIEKVIRTLRALPNRAGFAQTAGTDADRPSEDIIVEDMDDVNLLANSAADVLGVPDSWLRPVRDLLAEIEAKAADKNLSDAELLAYLEDAQRRLPELFGEMDVTAFAEVLEAGMGAAAVEGVRDAIRAKA